MIEETVISAKDLEDMLKPYDAVDEAVKRYPVCQSSAFRGMIVANAAQATQATDRAKAALEVPEKDGVRVKTADLKKLIEIQEDLFAAEQAYEYSLEGYRLFRNQATNIRKARNNVNAVESLKQTLALHLVSKSKPASEKRATTFQKPYKR